MCRCGHPATMVNAFALCVGVSGRKSVSVCGLWCAHAHVYVCMYVGKSVITGGGNGREYASTTEKSVTHLRVTRIVEPVMTYGGLPSLSCCTRFSTMGTVAIEASRVSNRRRLTWAKSC